MITLHTGDHVAEAWVRLIHAHCARVEAATDARIALASGQGDASIAALNAVVDAEIEVNVALDVLADLGEHVTSEDLVEISAAIVRSLMTEVAR